MTRPYNTPNDLDPPAPAWACTGRGAEYAIKPDRCPHCIGGYTFERIGTRTSYLHELAEVVAADMVESPPVKVKRGRAALPFDLKDLAGKVKNAKRHGHKQVTLSINQAEQLVKEIA